VGKYRTSQETTDRLRASWSKVLDVPEDLLPRGVTQEEYRKKIEDASEKVNAIKWWQKATIAKTDMNTEVNNDGDEIDRFDLTLQFDEAEPINAGRTLMAFQRATPFEEGETMDRQTEYTMTFIGKLVEAALNGEYVLADDGSNAIDETWLEALPGCEVMVKIKQGTRWVAKNKTFYADTDVDAFSVVE
jgi:hypothetical protein